MIIERREYQEKSIDRAVSFFKRKPKARTKSGNNEMQVLPTGAGKSICLARTALELDGDTLIFQPTKEILEQNLAKIKHYGFDAGVYSASLGRKDIDKITLATIGSVKDKAHLFRNVKNVMIDECHDKTSAKGGMYADFVNEIDAKILGYTATPFRLSTDGYGGAMLKFLTRTRPRMFSKVNYLVQTQELFEKGYLSKLEYYSVDGFDRNSISVNSTGADYNEKSLIHYYNKSGFNARVGRAVNRLLDLGRRGVLVFVPNIQSAEEIAAMVEGAVVLTGATPKDERKRILELFKSGIIRCVINFGVLVVGFDYPELDTVVMARPTMSLAVYYQILGRVVRPHPSKKSGWFIDMCGNYNVFGKMEDLYLDENGGKWIVTSKGKQLTNAYFGEVHGKMGR